MTKQQMINWAAGVFCPTLLLIAVCSISLFCTPPDHLDCAPEAGSQTSIERSVELLEPNDAG